MVREDNTKLSSAEISQLWTTYMNDSASICILSYFVQKVEDEEIKPLAEHVLNIATNHIDKMTAIFTKENHPIPYGFNLKEDVDCSAPRIFADTYVLHFIHQFSKIGLNGHSINLSIAVRDDVTTFFKECLSETMELYERSKTLLLTKGLYTRSPVLPTPKKTDYVKESSFFAGFLGEKRPLTVPEIMVLYSNFQRNALGIATMIGFGQIATEEDVKHYFKRGRDLADKQCEVFGAAIKKDFLPAPMTWSSHVTESTSYVFSDKLMMFFTTVLVGVSLHYFGYAISVSPRRDLGIMYNRLFAEIQLFAEDGAQMMIKYGWLEEPPKAPDRDELAH